MSAIEDAQKHLDLAAKSVNGVYWYESDIHLNGIVKQLEAAVKVIDSSIALFDVRTSKIMSVDDLVSRQKVYQFTLNQYENIK